MIWATEAPDPSC